MTRETLFDDYTTYYYYYYTQILLLHTHTHTHAYFFYSLALSSTAMSTTTTTTSIPLQTTSSAAVQQAGIRIINHSPPSPNSAVSLFLSLPLYHTPVHVSFWLSCLVSETGPAERWTLFRREKKKEKIKREKTRIKRSPRRRHHRNRRSVLIFFFFFFWPLSSPPTHRIVDPSQAETGHDHPPLHRCVHTQGDCFVVTGYGNSINTTLYIYKK